MIPDVDLHRATRSEVEREVMWIIAALAARTEDRAIRIYFHEILQLKPGARIERHQDPAGRFIEYRLCDD